MPRERRQSKSGREFFNETRRKLAERWGILVTEEEMRSVWPNYYQGNGMISEEACQEILEKVKWQLALHQKHQGSLASSWSSPAAAIKKLIDIEEGKTDAHCLTEAEKEFLKVLDPFSYLGTLLRNFEEGRSLWKYLTNIEFRVSFEKVVEAVKYFTQILELPAQQYLMNPEQAFAEIEKKVREFKEQLEIIEEESLEEKPPLTKSGVLTISQEIVKEVKELKKQTS